jgi:predicted alpha/beta hydrolase
LYGAPPSQAQTAALICAPLGHEYVRAHFVLQRLARRLAEAGVPTLRFDYYGCFDSLGDGSEATCTRWQRDIVAAHQELRQRTGAGSITAIGVRFGATLLANVAEEAQFSKLVLWDPVESGSRYLADLRAAQRRLIRASPLLSLRGRLNGWTRPHELLGATYSRSAVKELAQMVMPRAHSSSCKVERYHSDAEWLDLEKLEDMLPDSGISRQLSRLLLEAQS